MNARAIYVVEKHRTWHINEEATDQIIIYKPDPMELSGWNMLSNKRALKSRASVAGRFEMSGRSCLPRHRRLLGLFDKTLKVDFSGSEEFGVATLQENGQEHVESPFVPSGEQDSLDDGVHGVGCRGTQILCIAIVQ